MSQRRQLLMIVGIVAAVTALFFVFLLKPKIAEIGTVRQQVEDAKAEETQLRADIARLERIRQRAPELTARLAVVSSLLPSTPDLPNFIRLFQGAATEAAVDLQSIAPSAPATLAGSQGIETISVTAVVRGSFHRMEDFLTRVEQLRRIVMVTSLGLAPQIDELSGQTILQATVTMRMFVVQADARLGAGAGAGAGAANPSPAASPSPAATS